MTKKINAVILIARSGAGKGTVSKALIALAQENKQLVFKTSVSDTTRSKKDTETDGVEYNFISQEEFDRRKAIGWYIETDQYAGNWYGSPKNQFLENKTLGIVTVFDVEPNGAEELELFIGKENCKIFRLVVPLPELKKRVKGRNRDSKKEQADRVSADVQRMPKMMRLGIPISYGENAIADVAANKIYNSVLVPVV